MPDPTLAAIRALSDPNLFVCVRDVPIFDAHSEYDAKGKLLRRFGREELQKLADTCNMREQATGDMTLIGPGHTLRHQYDAKGNIVKAVPEDEQPIPFGIARNFRVGAFGPSQKLGLLCDQYVRKDKYDEYLTFPRRSIELWYNRNEIDWIACKRAAPERDLGLITDLAPPPTASLTPLTSSEYGQAYQREEDGLLVYEMGEYFAGGAATVGPGEPSSMERAMTDLKKEIYESNEWKHLKGLYDASVAAGPSVASGGNTYVPGTVKQPERHERQGEPDRYEKELLELRSRVTQAEAKAAGFDEVVKVNEKLRLDYQRMQREADLRQLVEQHYDIDPAKLIDEVAPLAEAEYKARLDFIRQYGRQSPIGEPIAIFRGPAEGGVREKELTREEMQAAASWATRNGKSFDEGKAAIRKN